MPLHPPQVQHAHVSKRFSRVERLAPRLAPHDPQDVTEHHGRMPVPRVRDRASRHHVSHQPGLAGSARLHTLHPEHAATLSDSSYHVEPPSSRAPRGSVVCASHQSCARLPCAIVALRDRCGVLGVVLFSVFQPLFAIVLTI